MAQMQKTADSPALTSVQPGPEYVGPPIDRQELISPLGHKARMRRRLSWQVPLLAFTGVVAGAAVSIYCGSPWPFIAGVLLVRDSLKEIVTWVFKPPIDHEPFH